MKENWTIYVLKLNVFLKQFPNYFLKAIAAEMAAAIVPTSLKIVHTQWKIHWHIMVHFIANTDD